MTQNGIIIFVYIKRYQECVDEDSSPFLIATERDARRFHELPLGGSILLGEVYEDHL